MSVSHLAQVQSNEKVYTLHEIDMQLALLSGLLKVSTSPRRKKLMVQADKWLDKRCQQHQEQNQ